MIYDIRVPVDGNRWCEVSFDYDAATDLYAVTISRELLTRDPVATGEALRTATILLASDLRISEARRALEQDNDATEGTQ